MVLHLLCLRVCVCVCVCVCVSPLVTRSCQTLCDPMDCNLPGSSVHGIFQARTLEWVAVPSSRGSSQPRDLTFVCCISFIGRCILTTVPPEMDLAGITDALSGFQGHFSNLIISSLNCGCRLPSLSPLSTSAALSSPLLFLSLHGQYHLYIVAR